MNEPVQPKTFANQNTATRKIGLFLGSTYILENRKKSIAEITLITSLCIMFLTLASFSAFQYGMAHCEIVWFDDTTLPSIEPTIADLIKRSENTL